MARPNPLRGEAKLGNQLLRVNFDAWIAFEEKTGRRLPDHILDMELGLGAAQMADWVQAFLAEETDRAGAVALMQAAGHRATMAALGAAVKSFFAAETKDDPENPPKAG